MIQEWQKNWQKFYHAVNKIDDKSLKNIRFVAEENKLSFNKNFKVTLILCFVITNAIKLIAMFCY